MHAWHISGSVLLGLPGCLLKGLKNFLEDCLGIHANYSVHWTLRVWARDAEVEEEVLDEVGPRHLKIMHIMGEKTERAVPPKNALQILSKKGKNGGWRCCCRTCSGRARTKKKKKIDTGKKTNKRCVFHTVAARQARPATAANATAATATATLGCVLPFKRLHMDRKDGKTQMSRCPMVTPKTPNKNRGEMYFFALFTCDRRPAGVLATLAVVVVGGITFIHGLSTEPLYGQENSKGRPYIYVFFFLISKDHACFWCSCMV